MAVMRANGLLAWAAFLPLLTAALAAHVDVPSLLSEKRQTSQTDVCKRWAHQSAVVNGTLYLYGGRATMNSTQNSSEWNNNFLSLDLTKTWQISDPTLTGLAQPAGPPAVASGCLWSSYDALYLYGGEFSDTPVASPVPYSMWEYDISTSNWKEHSSPQTSQGTNAPDNGTPVERAAEGAGISMAALGRGWYFGGHEDFLTVNDWAISVPRIYLTSLLEFTFPGYSNPEVQALGHGTVAGSDGVWRNITEGALATQAGFPERADGVLVYIPGFGDEGLLLGLAGGDQATFTQLNIIDIFDIATSTWYKQATSGPTPKPRVNPCAVVAATADGSSYQVYMFAGQQLQPAGEQAQYDDLWILSVPSFTWMEVDMSTQPVPPGRSGHTCNIWDAQMVVVGGYVGEDLSCDYGFYVFNTSSLEWVNQFTALSDPTTNPQSQQIAQLDNSTGLAGSFGYTVPDQVQSLIGGSAQGGATATAPAATATSGPLSTGRPVVYQVPNDTNAGSTGSGSNYTKSGKNVNTGAIIAGVIAGVAVIIAVYLAIVTYIYRKRMRQYKANVDRYGWPSNKEQGRGRRRENDEDEDDAAATLQRRTSSADLLGNKEPTFVGIMLHPRRSLRITNPD